MIKKIKYLTFLVIALSVFTSCSNEDDIESIFFAKTWYVKNFMAHGSTPDIDEKDAEKLDKTGYRIVFNTMNTCTVVVDGKSIEGTCTIEAEGRVLRFQLKGEASVNDALGRKLVEWLRKTTHYKGDVNQLQLHQDESQNFIILGKDK